MIRVHTDLGIVTVEYIAGMTITDAVTKLTTNEHLEIRGGWAMRETKTGRVLDPSEAVVDHRYYYLTAFLFRRRKIR